MEKVFLIFVGGGLGSVCRYWVSGIGYKFSSSSFPYGTLLVNLIGSLIIGFLFEFSQERFLPASIKPLVMIGFLGGFTTFSTFTLESMNLLKDKEYMPFLSNMIFSNIGGLFLVFAGILIFRFIYGGK